MLYSSDWLEQHHFSPMVNQCFAFLNPDRRILHKSIFANYWYFISALFLIMFTLTNFASLSLQLLICSFDLALWRWCLEDHNLEHWVFIWFSFSSPYRSSSASEKQSYSPIITMLDWCNAPLMPSSENLGTHLTLTLLLSISLQSTAVLFRLIGAHVWKTVK